MFQHDDDADDADDADDDDYYDDDVMNADVRASRACASVIHSLRPRLSKIDRMVPSALASASRDASTSVTCGQGITTSG
jgi:hypothetical protein